jgi:uncharacterized protein
MSIMLQFAIGLLFGVGLVVGGMSDPAKVLNFLDIAAISAGTWDPSLAFVMGGGIAATVVGFRFVFKMSKPIFGETFHLPSANELDARVVIGPAIFGVGWGLAGFCPGPAFTALGGGTTASLIFVTAMMTGMYVARTLASHRTRVSHALN